MIPTLYVSSSVQEVCSMFARLEIFIFIWICLRSYGCVVECIGEVVIIIGVRIPLILTVYVLLRSNSLHGVTLRTPVAK